MTGFGEAQSCAVFVKNQVFVAHAIVKFFLDDDQYFATFLG